MSLSPSDYLCVERNLAVSSERMENPLRRCKRRVSGAWSGISEGNCPERIITLAGPTSAVFKASAMVIDKEEEDVNSLLPTAQLPGEPQSP